MNPVIQEWTRFLVIGTGFLALLVVGYQLYSYRRLMVTPQIMFLVAVMMYQIGSVYGSTDAYVRDVPVRASIIFPLIGHLIVLSFGIMTQRTARQYYANSVLKKMVVDTRKDNPL